MTTYKVLIISLAALKYYLILTFSHTEMDHELVLKTT